MNLYSHYVPFIKESRTVGLRTLQNIDHSRILHINHLSNIEELQETVGPLKKYLQVPFYYERNSDIYIPMCQTKLEYVSLALALASGDVINGNIVDIDYGDVARNIEIETGEAGSMTASLSVTNGELTSELLDDNVITAIANGRTLNLSELEEVKGVFNESVSLSGKRLTEAFELKPDVNVGVGSSVSIDVQDAFEEYVYNYIKSEKMLAKNRVPLLIGTTAVAKSSLIKSIVKQLDSADKGYRLIDFRAAFIDKNDIEGFATKLKDSNNEYYAEMSPMRELVEATDEYLAYARATLVGLDAKIAGYLAQDEKETLEEAFATYQSTKDETVRADKREVIKQTFDNLGDNADIVKQLVELKRLYKEKSKTPVLFFDEITRAPREARNAFTTILNTKAFLNYKMTEARIVAATNYPVGMPEDYIMVYTTEEIDDIAALERFEPFVVMPSDVYPRWEKWAEDNIEPAVLDFIKSNPDAYAYALNTVMDTVDNNPDFDEFNAAELPFPNFRTWEYVSTYIRETTNRKEDLSRKMIESLIGENDVSRDLMEFLYDDGYVFEDESTISDEFAGNLRSGILSGVPVLLSGPTSYGKTTRVKNVADELGAILVEINLATKDATQIKGIPTPVPVSDTVLYGSTVVTETLPDDVKALLADTRSHGVSGNTTDYMPDKYIRDMLLEASRTGRPVILFFDEVNRCDKTVLSSVFEAVSDNRYMGVTFKPGQVRVVAAANLGGQYGDVTQLDPAFSARFAMVRKDEYDIEDVKSFKKYVDSKDSEGNPRYSKVVAEFIKDQDDYELLEALKAVEERTLLRAAPTMRAWDDISQMVMNAEKDNPFSGKVVFAKNTFEGESLQNLGYSRNEIFSDQEVDVIKSVVQTFPRNWVGLISQSKLSIPGLGNYTTTELFEGLQMLADQIVDPTVPVDAKKNYTAQIRVIIKSLSRIEDKLLDNRRTMIEAKLGTDYDIVDKFVSYYDSVSGDSIIELKDLVDASLIEEYVKRITMGLANDQLLVKCSDFIDEFQEYFKESLSETHYQNAILSCHDALKFPDAMLEWWTVCLTSNQFRAVVTLATETDTEFNYVILRKLGVPIDAYRDEIENYYA